MILEGYSLSHKGMVWDGDGDRQRFNYKFSDKFMLKGTLKTTI
jgi:hypothetical protein